MIYQTAKRRKKNSLKKKREREKKKEKPKEKKGEKKVQNQKEIAALRSSASVFCVDNCVLVQHIHNKHGITEELDYIRANISMD